jgi:hypothetical protein
LSQRLGIWSEGFGRSSVLPDRYFACTLTCTMVSFHIFPNSSFKSCHSLCG